jgi:hypothetical protein
MKRLDGVAALAVAAAARPGNGQPVYRLESAVTLKGIASDRSTLTFDSARGYLFIGRRGVAVPLFE